VRFGFNRANNIGNGTELLVAGGQPGQLDGTAALNTGLFMGVPAGISTGGGTAENLMVNLPAAGATGAVNFLIGKVGSFLLQLELSAAEQEGKADIISSPRVVTANQSKATIKSGVEIPYQLATSSGATAATFKEAVLQLEVTPQITPDDRIFMKLAVKKDIPDFSRAVNGEPPINTQKVETEVLVGNGETVVLGGIFERNKTNNYNKIPFFADLPAVGQLFKEHAVKDQNSELLVFVTPKILKETLSLQ
jgi:type IV pilus assembly protein PilQ